VKGQVLFGINNIYTVDVQGQEMQCRIKGKVLKQEKRSYSPLAVGDYVEVHKDKFSDKVGWIIGREERRNFYSRWNRKKKVTQFIASNVDLLIIVTSPEYPPFRPRFIDRMLICAELGKIKPLILMNKCDLKIEMPAKKRLADFQRIGYQVIFCSALTGQGIKKIKKLIKKKTVVFAGQSGVGKSSILNSIEPYLNLKVGEISNKYDRGIHTTNFAVMIKIKGSYNVIDTPGIRELNVSNTEPQKLRFFSLSFWTILMTVHISRVYILVSRIVPLKMLLNRVKSIQTVMRAIKRFIMI